MGAHENGKDRASQAGFQAGAAAADAATSVESVAAFTESGIEDLRRKRAKRRRGLVVAGALACLVAAYVGVSAFYSAHFLPHTAIGSYDVSGLSVGEAISTLDAGSGDYALSVSGGGLDFQVTSEETGLRVDSAKVVQKALDQNTAWAWPLHLFGGRAQDLTDAMQATFDESGLGTLIDKQVKSVNKKASAPVDATIAYDKQQASFVIVPEQAGTKLDKELVAEKVEKAAIRMEPAVEIGEDELVQPAVLAGDAKLAAAQEKANGMLGATVALTLAGMEWKTVGTDLIASWIAIGKDAEPSFSEDAMRKWTGKQAQAVNTIGAQRSFETPRGDKVTVTGGSYGWNLDYEAFVSQLKEAVLSREDTTLDVPCTSTAASIPNKNNVDFGKRYVDVNLSTQHAVFYKGKKVLWESDFISGAPDGEHDTPKGTYEVNMKESPSKLVGEMQPVEITTGKGKKKKTTVEMRPEYETEVQFWMPFVGNGVGFHDATWQPGFGGTMYADGYGSHGCVNLSYEAAEELYGIIEAGTPVIVHD